MLGELPFEADNAANPRSHRRRRGRSGFTFLLVVVLLGALGAGGWFGFQQVRDMFAAEDFEGDGNGVEVVVEIPEGASLSTIATVLEENGVVASTEAFVAAAEAEPDATGIQPGVYVLQEQMSGQAAVAALLDLDNRNVNAVTIPEGVESWVVYELLSESSGIPVEEFEAAAEDPEALGVPDFWFERSDGKEITKSIEGFLYPLTYEFQPGMTAEEMLSLMIDHFLSTMDSLDFVSHVESELGITPYEALIVASLSQAEAGVPEDLGKVSRVAYNRAYKEFYCTGELMNCLQFDVTTNYGLMVAGGEKKESKDLTYDDLNDSGNLWSTHVYAGLPPTAINNPGQLALEGAMSPPDGDWYFFVAVDKEGNSKFAETQEEHEQNIAEAEANGVL